MSEQKKKIVVIEDDQFHLREIAGTFIKQYDVFPNPDSKEFEDLSSCYSTYNRSGWPVAKIQKRIKTITEFLNKHAPDTVCYIIDYRLKNTDAPFVGSINGVEFCKNFEAEMKGLPIIFLTNTPSAREMESIFNFANERSEQAKCVKMLAKPVTAEWSEDAEFYQKLKKTLKDLVDNCPQIQHKPKA
ncbi:MAG: hypothetical protein V4592_08325 [Bacteroidota bacterium]